MSVETPPIPLQSQLIKVWSFAQNVDGTFSPSAPAGSAASVNLTGINGSAPALTNPLPVELSDGTNPFGTVSNPIKVGVSGNAGAAFDAPATGTAPANVLYQGDRAATTYPTAATDGQ